VLNVDNSPAKPVLAIHAGSVRRQAKLEVNHPFVIPHPGSQTGSVEVSLFQQLASHVLPDDGRPEAFCHIPVRKLDGTASQVKLRVRRGDLAFAADSPKSPKFDSMGVTRDYLDYHQLQQRIQSLIQDVLREQPEDPYRYMLEQLRKAQAAGGGGGATGAEVQAAPVAPTLPRPPGSPPPGRKGRSHAAQLNAVNTDVRGEANPAHAKETLRRRAPVTEEQKCALWTVRKVLKSPSCHQAGIESLRAQARKRRAKGCALPRRCAGFRSWLLSQRARRTSTFRSPACRRCSTTSRRAAPRQAASRWAVFRREGRCPFKLGFRTRKDWPASSQSVAGARTAPTWAPGSARPAGRRPC